MFDLPALGKLLTAEDFDPYVGAMFSVASEPQAASIQLVSVKPLISGALAHRAAFSLFFRSSPQISMVSGAYMMSCGGFGPLHIHLTPVLSPPGERLYEAVFA